MHQILCEDAVRPCADDHVTKSRNRKLILVTSSNESQNRKCVDLSDYNVYLNQIRLFRRVDSVVFVLRTKFGSNIRYNH